MGRPATGSVVEPRGPRKSWAIRFRVNGVRQNITLGRSEDGWTRRKAEHQLEEELAAVRLGLWKPPKAASAIELPTDEQTFHEFAESWFEAGRQEWSERTIRDYQQTLELHVLPFFGEMRLGEITIETVDRFRTKKLSEKKLAAAQNNKCIKRVSQILGVAEEYDIVPRNVARGKKRKAKEPAVRKTWIEPEQVMTLIEESKPFIKPVVAVLLGTGLRPGELVALDWGDVSLGSATITVGRAKTDTGSYREIDLPAGVVEILGEWWGKSEQIRAEWKREHGGEEPLFLTKVEGGRYSGQLRRQTEANVSRRLKTSIKRANVKLGERGIDPISDKVTPYSCRRTYASIRAALGDDPLYVSEQMGHKDVRFTLNVYSRAVKRRSKLSDAYRTEFDRALDWAKLPTSKGNVWAQMGTDDAEAVASEVEGAEDSAL
ncbi:MAG: site-specific integrase [Actinobacteria bacterium]|nr:site-specific integrase [Actinomycetota bacterium]